MIYVGLNIPLLIASIFRNWFILKRQNPDNINPDNIKPGRKTRLNESHINTYAYIIHTFKHTFICMCERKRENKKSKILE